MKCLNRSMLIGTLITLLTALLLSVGGASAASPTCGAWRVVKSPNVGSNDNFLMGVAAVSASDTWAVGHYLNNSKHAIQTLIERWNGASWNVVMSPNVGTSNNELTSIAVVSANDIWAAGDYINRSRRLVTLTEHWNGSSWQVFSSPSPGSEINLFSSVAVISASNVWAVGFYQNIDVSTRHQLIEHWNGTSWSVVKNPDFGVLTNALFGATAVSASDIWTVGYFVTHNGIFQTLVEHWNGTSWSVVQSPNPDAFSNILSGVTALSASNVWAVGERNGATLIEQWNGTSWNVVQSPNVGTDANYLNSVAAVSANNLWAVGFNFTRNNKFSQTLIEHWNGTMWSVVPSPSPGTHANGLNGVTTISNALWAVGLSINIGGSQQTLTEFFC